MKLVPDSAQLPLSQVAANNHDPKVSVVATSSKTQQLKLTSQPNGFIPSGQQAASAENGLYRMNHSESSSYPEETMQVDENGNNTKLPPSASPALTTGNDEASVSQPAAAVGLKDTSSASNSKLEGKELAEQLQRQLEYYFSRENLAQDPYLVSQMDQEMYVPIWTIANFNAVKKLTSNLDLVIEALKASSLVQVDEKEEKVRPNQTRSSVILREIPGETPKKSVEDLFSGEDCPKFLSLDFAGGTSWYVTFANQTDALAAQRHLREKVVTFLGKPIMARIKFNTGYIGGYNYPPRPQAIPKSDHQSMMTNGGTAPTIMATQQTVQAPNPQVSSQSQQQQQIPPPPPPPPPQPQMNPQPMEYPSMLIYPHGTVPHGANNHPNSHTHAHIHNQPPFIARVASSPASNGTQPVLSNISFIPTWPGMYPHAPDVLGHPHYGFLAPTYKTSPASSQSSSKLSGYPNPPRYTDVHKGLNQSHRNYTHRKPAGSYNQSQQSQQSSMQVQSQTLAAGSQYILSSDPNPPGLEYGQNEQSPIQVAHSPHYVPAIRHPFVTPSADLLMMQQRPTGQSAAVMGPRHHQSRDQQRGNNIQMTGAGGHRDQRLGKSNPGVTGANSMQRNANRQQQGVNRSYQNSHHPEISPRFQQQKGMSQQPHHHAVPFPIQNVMTVRADSLFPLSGAPDQRAAYSAPPPRNANGMQRNRASPHDEQLPPDDHKYNEDQMTDSSQRNNMGQRTLASTQPTSGSYADPRNGRPMMPRNARQRRGRREDEKGLKSPPPPNAMVNNTPFTADSSSFPPLPGQNSTAVQALVMTSAVTSVKKYSEISSAPMMTVPPPHVISQPPQPISHPTLVAAAIEHKPEIPTNNEDKTSAPQGHTTMVDGIEGAAINLSAQPRVHTSAARSVPSSSVESTKVASQVFGEGPRVAKPEPQPSSNAAESAVTNLPPVTMPTGHRPSSFKKAVASPKPDSSLKQENAVAKGEPSNANARAESVQKHVAHPREAKQQGRASNESKDTNSSEDDKPPRSPSPTQESEGKKPTYAEMLRKQKAEAAAAAAQLNGKESSDSGDDVRAPDEVRDASAEPKSPNDAASNQPIKSHRNQRQSRGSATDNDEANAPQGNHPGERRYEGGMPNGGVRRGGYEYSRNRDRGNYYRREYDNRREYSYSGGGRGGGQRDFRPRGGGSHRGSRRGNFRDQYSSNSRAPVNGQPPAASAER